MMNFLRISQTNVYPSRLVTLLARIVTQMTNHQDNQKRQILSISGIITVLVLMTQAWGMPSQGQVVSQQPDTTSEQKLSVANAGPQLKYRLTGHTTPIRSLVFSPNGRTLISGGGTNEPFLKFWSLESGEEVDTLRAQNSAVLTLVIPPDGKTLISSGEDADIHFWAWPESKSKVTFFDHYSYVLDLAVTPDSQFLVSGALDGIRIWTLNPPHLLYQLEDFGTPAYALTVHPNGFLLASGDDQGKVRFWNLRDRSLVSEFTAHSEAISGLAITPDGRTLITSSNDKTIKLWDIASGNLLDIWRGHKGKVQAIALSPNGKILASASIDGVRLWSVERGRLVRHLDDNQDWVNTLAFSPDGRFLASGGFERVVNVWEVPPSFYDVPKSRIEILFDE